MALSRPCWCAWELFDLQVTTPSAQAVNLRFQRKHPLAGKLKVRIEGLLDTDRNVAPSVGLQPGPGDDAGVAENITVHNTLGSDIVHSRIVVVLFDAGGNFVKAQTTISPPLPQENV
jgi:hypothetical protein